MTSASREIGGAWSNWDKQCSSLWTLEYTPDDATKLVATFGHVPKNIVEDALFKVKQLSVGGFIFRLITDWIVNKQVVMVLLKEEFDDYYPKFGD